MQMGSRCARCGTLVDLRVADTAKVPRSIVPADLDLPYDDGLGTLVALFCA